MARARKRERRREKRTRRRISCRLRLNGRDHVGIVLDVSSHGLFVQTHAKGAPGTPTQVQLGLPGSGTRLVVEATVARQRRVHPTLTPVWPNGIGLRVMRPPPEWQELIDTFAAIRSQATQSFCVRAAQLQDARTRMVLVTCASEALAREMALAELGEEWKVLSVELITDPALESTKHTS